MRKVLVAVAVCLLFVPGIVAQSQDVDLSTIELTPGPLSDAAVQAAIAEGQAHTKNYFVQVAPGFGKHGGSFFSRVLIRDVKLDNLLVLNPVGVIAQKTATNKEALLPPLKVSDVSADMRSMWVIVAGGAKPEKSRFGLDVRTASAGRVTNVILASKDGKVVIYPAKTEEGQTTGIAGADDSNFNLTMVTGKVAYFRDADVRKVAGEDLSQTFNIKVGYQGQTVWNTEFPVRAGELKALHGLPK